MYNRNEWVGSSNSGGTTGVLLLAEDYQGKL